MFLASDNAGPAHPKVMEALMRANEGYRMGYGADAEMAEVTRLIREIFEAPEASVHLVGTGTAANALLLATLTNPWDAIFCGKDAHIHLDECNAPEFYSGAKLVPIHTRNGKVLTDQLKAALRQASDAGVHGAQVGPVSMTQVTEDGTLYTLDQIKIIADIAKSYGAPVHLDGARFANAMAALNCTAAQMTWKVGVDAVSFGGTKNGLLGCEACIIFDPKHAREFELRRKRGGHLFSKHRFLSAQMLAYLTDNLWLTLAKQANAQAAKLAAGMEALPDVAFRNRPEANMIFANLPGPLHQRLQAAGYHYHAFGQDFEKRSGSDVWTGRFVTDWSATEADIATFLAYLSGVKIH